MQLRPFALLVFLAPCALSAQLGCGSSDVSAKGAGGARSSTGGSRNTGGSPGAGGTGAAGATLGGGGTVGSGGSAKPDASLDASISHDGAGSEAGKGGVDGARGSDGSSDGAGVAGLDTGTADRPTVTPAPSATLVKVNAQSKLQTFEGWGASLAWWGDWIGGWAADKRNALLDVIVDPQNGLGYNIFRYNIGGGENPSHTHMRAHGDIPGFEPTSGTWDFAADNRQIGVLRWLWGKGPGIILEAFSNSPPYWMTKSGCVSGSTDGGNNLKDDAYDSFADYLTEVVKYFRNTLGITFRTLEPMNEPNAGWWKSGGSQEGCHFDAASQQKIVKAVGARLAAKGLAGTTVSASDENSIDDAVGIMGDYDVTTLGYMSQMSTHSYYGSKRKELLALATAKKMRLWQSESGPLGATLATDLDAALFMADRIIKDLRELQPHAWLDWQIVDTSPAWTTFNVNDTNQSFSPNKRFYMHSGFSRFIRPGAVFVAIDNVDMVAALSKDGSKLAIVARNGDATASKSFTFDLTALPSLGRTIEVYRTSKTENLEHLPAVAVKDWSFTASLPPYSITTFVAPGTP